MTTHYHYGHGLTGYGPEEPGTCLSVTCLAECVRDALGGIEEAWGDAAYGERSYVEQLRKIRPTNGNDPIGYEGSWESIADAALRALECLDNADDVDTLRMNLRPERRNAPLYRQDLAAWSAELSRLLLESGTYPLDTTLDGNRRFYVWECVEFRCLLNEHDTEYATPETRFTGGYVPCACSTCMEILVWSPASGEAPYCANCTEEGCHERTRRECLVIREDDGGDE